MHTLADALINLPTPSAESNVQLRYSGTDINSLFKAFKNPDGTVSDHFSKPISGIHLERILSLAPGQTMKDLPEQLQHDSFMKRAKRRVQDGTPSEKRGGAPSGLKRLHMDQPSLTITGAATREFIHPVEDRPLTIREAARIQTFPDNFNFVVSQSERIQQIGNAIPPLLAQTFAAHIITFRSSDTKCSDTKDGRLIGFNLTKAKAMSPALFRTQTLLNELLDSPVKQLEIF